MVGDGLFCSAKFFEGDTQVVVRHGHARVNGDRLFVTSPGIVEPLHVHEDISEVDMCPGKVSVYG